ncbi:MAG TPA: hypothetical protein PLY42_11465 [Nitrospira sp.]|nr:DUF2892 domain-containing protein [Nitrospira sp.]MCW5796189.1 DUF2892 domain-containing protein [Nitrospira sp.]HMU31825.1 hypothetical protein [Nitrospira sp.]HMW85076.1 hypothetical protein [Nitrospira sp.]HMX91979.1 hypothetical protein [Nitrospira sp.]
MTDLIPPTTSRVADRTDADINARIRRQTEANVAYFAKGGAQAISERLRELDREWDVERLLEANAATIALTGLCLGSLVNRRWFLLPAVVGGFLLQHAVQGWCPPIPIFRRLGMRTQTEIEQERYALKAMRGDFANIPRDGDDRTAAVLNAVRA